MIDVFETVTTLVIGRVESSGKAEAKFQSSSAIGPLTGSIDPAGTCGAGKLGEENLKSGAEAGIGGAF